MIDTGASQEPQSAFRDSPNDIKSYVLDEFKDILFPKAKSNYELAQERAAQMRQEQENKENKLARQKILALAAMMKYDDDMEESQVTQTRQDEPTTQDPTPKQSSKQESKTKTVGSNNSKPSEMDKLVSEMGGDEEDDDEDDYLMDDPIAFIERNSSQQLEDAK